MTCVDAYGASARNQDGLCAGPCVFVFVFVLQYMSTGFVQCARANRFEQGAHVNELVRASVGFCAVRAPERFVQCASAMSSCPCSVHVWDQYCS